MAVDSSFQAPVLDLYIAPLGEQALRHCGEVARDLRSRGVSVELGSDGKLKRAMELANKMGARYALIVGDSEILAGRYALKDMRSGAQIPVDRDELIGQLTTKN